MPSPVAAEWCQCVIFVLNLMGIEQIPGDYWTAASLAVPDNSGNSWMNYQGFSKRSEGEIPQPGDLLLLAGGAEVETVQTWNGIEHLVPVPADVWAGNIGIVENAQKGVKEGQTFFQIKLLSANWGVNAKTAGVIGSCYNVDESVFLLPEGYKKAQFFFVNDAAKMRERVVKRAKRWSLFGLMANSLATIDGYPISPAGFVSAALQEPGEHPLKPGLVTRRTDFIEIYGTAVQPGDVVIYDEKNGETGFGIITEIGLAMNTSRQKVIKVISMQPGGKVTWIETLNVMRSEGGSQVLRDNPAISVSYFRYKRLQGYPIIG